jgi:PAS domain S-box-containing protein
MQNEYRSLISKIQQLEEKNSVSAEKAEDTLLLGMAADIIYQTEDSVLLADQILERISVLKDIPFCGCLEQGVDGLIVEGFYASFSEIKKDEIHISFSKRCSELLQTERYLILEESDFESSGLTVQFADQSLIPGSALIIPCFCKGIYNRYFLFLDNNKSSNRFHQMLPVMQQIVQLAAERLVNIFMYGELNRLNCELDRRVRERTQELTLTNKNLNREIHERKIVEKALRANERKLRSVYNAAIDVSFITFDLSDRFIVRSFSPGAEKMFGYLPREVVGKSLKTFHLLDHSEFFTTIRSDFEKSGMSQKDEVLLRRKSGELFTAMLTVYPLLDEELRLIDALVVCIDISELKQTQVQLIHAREKAEENDRLKTAFLQNMSHEIRTPMNAILGFADLLPEYFGDKEALHRFAYIIKQRGSDLLEILSDILDIARLESGQILHDPEFCKMADVIDAMEDSLRKYQNRIRKYDVEFNFKVPQNVRNLEIVVDHVRLNQIVKNLVINAFKFTNSGKIEAGCSLSCNNELKFFVSDTGIGISEEKHSEIFNRFTQAANDKSNLYGGTGLGLSIVKGLLDLMGGRIWLDSKPGEGSTFYFTIPFRIAEKKNETTLKAQPQIHHSYAENRILIVEDDEYNTDYLKEILSDLDLSVSHCIYGEKALDICRNQFVNVILMDIRLPDMPGFEFIREVRKINPGVKIIVQSSYDVSNDKERAFDAGCDEYLRKPLKSDFLLSRIKFYLQYFKREVHKLQ